MPLALIGGEEFADGFEDAHARLTTDLLARNPGRRALHLAFLPTCAADDGPATVERWCRTAEARLTRDRVQVHALPIADRRAATDPDLVGWLERADWIYFGGGYPHVGMRILGGTPALAAVRSAWQRGALISGASGGAMLMCSRSWVITSELEAAIDALGSGRAGSDGHLPAAEFVDCIGLLPATLCWPHMNSGFSLPWLEQGALPAQHTLIGLDEQTMLFDTGGDWEAAGRGLVRIVDRSVRVSEFVHGQRIPAPLLVGVRA